MPVKHTVRSPACWKRSRESRTCGSGEPFRVVRQGSAGGKDQRRMTQITSTWGFMRAMPMPVRCEEVSPIGAAPEDLESSGDSYSRERRRGLSSVTRSLRRRVTDSQLVGDRIEASVGRPYACPCDYDRGEQVGVDPSNPTPLQFPRTYEFEDFPVRYGRDRRPCVVAPEQS